ncbi:hypothetical protein GCM10027445_22870 [Amycolatopsis endophytica]
MRRTVVRRDDGQHQEQPRIPEPAAAQVPHRVGHVLPVRLRDAPPAEHTCALTFTGPQQEKDHQADTEHDSGYGDPVVPGRSNVPLVSSTRYKRVSARSTRASSAEYVVRLRGRGGP